jgi:hypothetical protein
MKSKKYVKSIAISNEARDRVLFEGALGRLERLSMIEGEVLEILGTKGVLRIDLNEDELRKIFSRKGK